MSSLSFARICLSWLKRIVCFANAERWVATRRANRLERVLRDMESQKVESGSLTGAFDIKGSLIVGWVQNTIEPTAQDLFVAVFRGSEVVGYANVGGPAPGAGWRFEIDTVGRVTDYDVFYERIRVVVRDSAGGVRSIRLTGGTELELIRKFIVGP